MFFFRKLQCERNRYGQNDYGEYVDDTEKETFNFNGSIQPLNQQEKTLYNKDGAGNENFIYCKLYTKTNIRLHTKGSKSGLTDYVLADGEKYEIISCDINFGGVINHCKYILQQVQPEPEQEEEENAEEPQTDDF